MICTSIRCPTSITFSHDFEVNTQRSPPFGSTHWYCMLKPLSSRSRSADEATDRTDSRTASVTQPAYLEWSCFHYGFQWRSKKSFILAPMCDSLVRVSRRNVEYQSPSKTGRAHSAWRDSDHSRLESIKPSQSQGQQQDTMQAAQPMRVSTSAPSNASYTMMTDLGGRVTSESCYTAPKLDEIEQSTMNIDAHSVNWSSNRSLPTILGTFDSLSRVLFIFRTSYLFAIGRHTIFSLIKHTTDNWYITPKMHYSCHTTQPSSQWASNTGLSPCIDIAFQHTSVPLTLGSIEDRSYNSVCRYSHWFKHGLFRCNSPLLTESLLLSFPSLNDMLKLSE